MKIESGVELMAEIKKYMYVNSLDNTDIAAKRGITKQSVGKFFDSANPRFSSLLETIDAMGAELHLEIKKKKDEEE